MFSKRLLTIVCLILFILTNIIFLSISAKHRHPETIIGKMAMAAVAPFQEAVVQTIRFVEHMWSHYFYLVSVRQECDRLQALLNEAKMEIGRYIEAEKASGRLAASVDTDIMAKALFSHYFGALIMFYRDPAMTPEDAAAAVLAMTQHTLAGLYHDNQRK